MTAAAGLSGGGRCRWLAGAARMGLALAAIAVLVVVGRRNAADLGRVRIRPRPGWLGVALPLYALSSLGLALGWRQELIAFGHRLPTRVAVRIWWRAQLARYVPTGLAAFASRAALAREAGVPASLGAASLAVELAALVGWGSLAAGVALPPAELGAPLRALLVAGAAGGLALLPVAYPRMARVARVGRRVPALETLASTPGRPAALYASLGLYGTSVAVKSAAFVAFTAALVSIRGGDVWLLAGAVQGAAVIGIIGITPAGIGVREGAMIGLLSHRLGTADAAAVAVAWRVWEFGFELGWLGLGTLWRAPRLRTGETCP